MKLSKDKEDYDQAYGWVGSPRCENPGDSERFIIENRFKLTIIGGVEDKDADYSYDDWALVRLGEKFWLLSTSGCSCPSPSETWRVEIGPATLNQVRKHVVDGDYQGYTVPKKQLDEFIALIDKAAAQQKRRRRLP